MFCLILLGAILSLLPDAALPLCQGTAKTFSPMTDSTILANPGRGFYHVAEMYASSYEPLVLTDLQSMRVNEKITLLLIEFVLDTFVTSNISSTFIANARADFATVRSAGMKSIVRFSYTQTDGDMNDAKLPQLRNHIVQLAPVFKENQDIILAVQAGFVGTWGEWYYSTNYATKIVDSSGGEYYEPSATQQAARNTIVSDLLGVLPASRQIQLRTPTIKQKYCNTTANLDPSQAFSTTNKCARLGIHNDCFMAADQDAGTFETDAQRTWLTNEGLYTVVGGETCEVNSQTGCTQALDQIAKQRFTYLNTDYHDTVISNWKTTGCFNAIANKLGYRFVLTSAIFPSSVARGSAFCASITVQNTGVAPIYNSHLVQVVLRNKANGSLSYFTQSAVDIRKWAPGVSSTLDLTFTVPSTLTTGTYDVLLNMPDALLRTNISYRILFANAGVQEASTRFNLLGQVTIA